MSDLFHPFDDTAAVKTYAILLDRQVGVLAAWKFMLERGFAPEEIIVTLSPKAHHQAKREASALPQD